MSKICFSSPVGLLAMAVLLSGCTIARQTNPPRTATEELLISSAADRAADEMLAKFPKGSTVYVDDRYFQGVDSKYTVSAIRDRLLRDGAHLVDSRGKASLVVEIRSGAQSIDDKTTLVGVPRLAIPLPLSGTFKIPEIPLYREKSQIGTAKVAMTVYDRKTGAYDFTVGPKYGYSHVTQWTVFFFISWTSNDLYPKQGSS